MNQLTILFVGDFCASTPSQIKVSEEIKAVFDSCDFKVLNFEGPLKTNTSNHPNNTILYQSDDSPKWCELNGFNVVSLANNHLLDFGESGCLKTIEHFSDKCVIGAGSWEDAYRVRYLECKGKKIGFFSASSSDLSSLQDRWTEKNKIGAAWINHGSVNDIITQAKKECDYLFVMVHAGIEHFDYPLPEWRDRYRELIDCGANAVVAAHPHVVQGWEVYKKSPIFYSLGNFFFDINQNHTVPQGWNNGIMVKINIDTEGEITFDAYPTIKKRQSISLDMSEDTQEHIKDITEILKDDQRYITLINEMSLVFYKQYINWFNGGLGTRDLSNHSIKNTIKNILLSIRHTKPNYKIALNQIREDSTRYILIRALKQMAQIK